jgi:4-phosphopantoate--beta-alanine ligase
MKNIPKSHPRYESLKIREKMNDALKKGLIHETGLIAHGRGEAFDYLIGEKTISFVDDSEKVAAACLIVAKKPVISVNGNVVALSSKECVDLSNLLSAKLEVNLFHRSSNRMKLLKDELIDNGAKKVYGFKGDAKIPGLDHNRGICDKESIFSSDVILVPLEDGDRCKALKNMGKKVIAIDLNPLSRTSRTADITIVDNIKLERLVNEWDNKKMLKDVSIYLSKRLNSLF